MILKKPADLIGLMSQIDQLDHRDLDGHLLQLLLLVLEEGSVTRAAQRLGVTQSAVSHSLDKLRAILGDPLFVRSGRGIVATSRAQALAGRARLLLDGLHGLVSADGFEPARFTGVITIAANDLQRDLLLPGALRLLRAQAPGLSLRVIPSGVPTPEMLRDGRCQLLITPRPPDAADLIQTRLFDDSYAVFFDVACRRAPVDLADYLAAEHVTVVYEPQRRLDLDDWLADQGVARRFIASVPGFAGLPGFLRGSDALATAPSRLAEGLLRGLAHCQPPLRCPALPMYLVWHARHQADAMHRWLRQAVAAAAGSPAGPGAAVAPAPGARPGG